MNIDKQNQTSPKTISNNSIFSQIKIGFHNINSIKENYYKAQELIELRTSSKLDIIGITETNIQEKEGCFIKINRKNYDTYWLGSKKEKHKGSGVGIWIENSWTQHLTEIKRPSPYCIKASLRIKKAIFSVWVIYILSNDKNKQKEV